ncbi:acyl carrier protein, partial [Bacillus sp. XF8]|uniref:acyl carrier protein n=1 Tax=Bacillus sp. XF8 TaxID=2819289 RepID=UPI001AA063DB
MDGQWKRIYRQLKGKEITPEEATEQFKRWGQHKKNYVSSDLLPTLKKIAAGVLAIDTKDIHHNVTLGEHGFDPLKLTQLADRLNNQFGLELNTKDLAEQNTLDDLAHFLQGINLSKGDQHLRGKIIDYLKGHLSLVFKVSAEEIDNDIDLEKYGINSIMVLKLTQQLEGGLGPLPKTLFFEYKTVNELTEYFLQHHR